MLCAVESLDMGQELDREKMKSLRETAGMNQVDAAGAAGIPGGASAWSDIENGRRANVTLDTLSKIAKALGCDARDLIKPPAKRKK